MSQQPTNKRPPEAAPPAAPAAGAGAGAPSAREMTVAAFEAYCARHRARGVPRLRYAHPDVLVPTRYARGATPDAPGTYTRVEAAFLRAPGGTDDAPALGERVVLKHVKFVLEDEMYVMQEPYTMSRVPPHPNILRLRECFCQNGEMTLEMDHGGTTLTAHVGARIKSGGWTAGEAAHAMRGVLAALAWLHRAEVVHCDVKWENVLVGGPTLADRGARPRIRLADFGSARLLVGGGVEFYPDFEVNATGLKPPETLLALPFGRGVDVWAAGCLLVWLLGPSRAPFDYTITDPAPALAVLDRAFGPLPAVLWDRPEGVRVDPKDPRMLVPRPAPEDLQQGWRLDGTLDHLPERARELARMMLHPEARVRASAEEALAFLGEEKK